MSKVKWNLILPPIALFLLAAIWAPISPVASAADDDYHLASIWCASGKIDLCYKTPVSNQYFVPKAFTELPPCYVDWSREMGSAKCAYAQSSDLMLSERVNTGAYPDLFYTVSSLFASQDLYQSVLKIRIFNSFLASLFFAFAIYVSTFSTRRALIISWGVAISPIGIFFIPSTNPSSWSIIGIGVFWAFLLSAFDNLRVNRKKFIYSILGLAASAVVAIGARFDSAIYIFLIILSILTYKYNTKWIFDNVKNLILLGILFVLPTSFLLFYFFVRRWGLDLKFPSAQLDPVNQPNAVVNTLIEMPAFLVGIFGGQFPSWLQPTGNLGRDYTFGAGWLEFSFPSITGVLIAGSVMAMIMIGFNSSSTKKTFAFLLLLCGLVIIILYSRAALGFESGYGGTYFQPRYFIPLMLGIIGISLLNETKTVSIFTTFQTKIFTTLLLIGSLLAWQATLTRYTINPQAVLTNFAQAVEWWPFPQSISRLDIFLISLFIHIFWLSTTVYIWGKAREKSTDTYMI